MKDFILNLWNAYTLIDLVLILGFATSTIILYQKNRKMKASFHNTTQEEGQLLISYEEKAQKQEEKILDIFRKESELTASQAWKKFGNPNVPITSIRRAISNLASDKIGVLIKTDKKQQGLFGSPEYFYRLKTA